MANRQVLHLAGQSVEQIIGYVGGVCADGGGCPLPVGLSGYGSLHARILDKVQFSPGNTQDARWLATDAGAEVVHLALWLHATELAAIGDGAFDAAIDTLGRDLASLDRRVLLRVGYEFDGPHNAFDPDEYQRAFRRVAERLRPLLPIEFVWHSYAWQPTFGGHDILRWYPGDEFVDWIGMTVFTFALGDDLRARLVNIAADCGKRVMLAECSPLRLGAPTGEAWWESWFQPFFDFINTNDPVSAFSIIECDWDSIEQSKHLGWGDARISSDETVLTLWRQQMSAPTAQWVHRSSA